MKTMGSSSTEQEFPVSPDASEVVLPTNQSGFYRREVDRWAGGVNLKMGMFSVSVDYLEDSADNLVVRTDVTDLQRWRKRAAVKLEKLELALSGEKLEGDNTVPENLYAVSGSDWTLEERLSPGQPLIFWGSYGRVKSHAAVLIRRPESFQLRMLFTGRTGNW